MLNIKKVQLLSNYIVTTKDVYTAKEAQKESLITKMVGSLKEFQKVIAVGPMVRTIKEGDLVCINPKRYAKRKYQEGSLKDNVITENPVISYNFNVIELDHKEYLLLTDQDVDFIALEYEEEENPIIVPENKLIIN